MKKIVFASSILLGLILTSFTTLNSSAVPIDNNNNNNSVNCYYGQCNATAASTGQRCRHCVSNEGDWYCWQH